MLQAAASKNIPPSDQGLAWHELSAVPRLAFITDSEDRGGERHTLIQYIDNR